MQYDSMPESKPMMTIQESVKVCRFRGTGHPRRVLVVGAGYGHCRSCPGRRGQLHQRFGRWLRLQPLLHNISPSYPAAEPRGYRPPVARHRQDRVVAIGLAPAGRGSLAHIPCSSYIFPGQLPDWRRLECGRGRIRRHPDLCQICPGDIRVDLCPVGYPGGGYLGNCLDGPAGRGRPKPLRTRPTDPGRNTPCRRRFYLNQSQGGMCILGVPGNGLGALHQPSGP